MYSHRVRGRPSQSVANVLCQKCLKRDMCHYSYDCKSSVQERPYVSRPSRSQQLRNPKLVPELTNNILEPLEEKKGVANAELAKREAERAKKRQLEEHEDKVREASRRTRSLSADSVSTVATSSPKYSRLSRNQTRSPTPIRRGRSPWPANDQRRRRRRRLDRSDNSYSSYSNHNRSLAPPQRHARSLSPESRSPPRHKFERSYRTRDDRQVFRDKDDSYYRRKSRSRSVEGRAKRQLDRNSASPGPEVRGKGRWERTVHRSDPHNRARDDHDGTRVEMKPLEELRRERSLSPFSKRLAMTRQLGGGRR